MILVLKPRRFLSEGPSTVFVIYNGYCSSVGPLWKIASLVPNKSRTKDENDRERGEGIEIVDYVSKLAS